MKIETAQTIGRGHTPGPWRVVESGSGDGARPALILAKHLRVIVDHRENFGDPGSDARLIAAAPDLLALLIQLRDDWFEPHYGTNDVGMGTLLRDKIRTAIAKAEGR